jgi:hypothetical protein
MNIMKTSAALLVAACVLGAPAPGTQMASRDGMAATYESLANAIIAIRETEDNLVRDILTMAADAAVEHLEMAASTEGTDRKKHIEMAAKEITNVAMEGDKRIQAIRQRLLKAGHHHHTDAETEEDYMFIDSGERKGMLELAGAVTKPGMSSDEIRKKAGTFMGLFEQAMAAE